MAEEKKSIKYDAMTVLYLIYLLYKANILSRHNLKQMSKIIKDTPEDLDFAKAIVEEANKAT